MTAQSPDELQRKKCVPCEGGVPAYSADEVRAQLAQLPDWRLSDDGRRIVREWTAKHFRAAMEFFHEVARVAEGEQHHPDLHLESYRRVRIEIYTHAVDGLTENDFILAAKIDRLPIREATSKKETASG